MVVPQIFIDHLLLARFVLLHLGAEVQLQIHKTLLVLKEAFQVRQLLNLKIKKKQTNKKKRQQQAADNKQESDVSKQSVHISIDSHARTQQLSLENHHLRHWYDLTPYSLGEITKGSNEFFKVPGGRRHSL